MASSDEIYQLIVSHNAFFGKIIDMIPRDLYRAKEETEESVASQKYYKHRKQPLAPDEKKEIRKRKLSEKYASSEPSAPADEDEDEDPAESSSQMQIEQEPASSGADEDANFTSLREKLQERIKMLHNDRVSQKEHKKEKPAKVVMTKAERKAANKLKASSTSGQTGKPVQDKSREVMSALLKSSSGSATAQTQAASSSGATKKADPYVEEINVEYGTITGVNTGSSGDSSMANAKSGGKINRLKRMLDEADKKHKRLAELKSTAINQVIKDGDGGASGNNVALNKLRAEQWSDALKDASGTSSMTDTDKLKKAIKRIEKKKAKSSEQWHDRKATEEGLLQKKIASREKNIAGRKNGGVVPTVAEDVEGGEGGSGSASKRPRLFMAMKQKEDEKNFGADKGDGKAAGGGGKPKNRAGFEGKKSDFLNKPKQKK